MSFQGAVQLAWFLQQYCSGLIVIEMIFAKYKPVKYEIIRLTAQKDFEQKLWKMMSEYEEEVILIIPEQPVV